MDEQRERIAADLRGLLDGEVHCDDVSLHLYSSDASIFQIKPLGVVMPRSTADVIATVKYADENQIPLHARGAGSGLAGESIGPGLVIDFSKSMRRVLSVNESSVCLQPGVVLERLNDQLAEQDRCFGPDPANGSVTTMGSVVAIDAAGSRWLRYGSAQHQVRHLQIVLADGTALDIGREPLKNGISHDPHPRKRELINELAALLSRESELIAGSRPDSCVNRCGYNVWDVLGKTHLDLPRLLCGSEGTLALFTELTLETSTVSPHRGLIMLLFDRLDDAARAALEILPFSPTACDLMDRRHITLARESEPRYDLLIPPRTEALLLVELEGEDPVDVQDSLRRIGEHIQDHKRLSFSTRLASQPDDVTLFWQLARKVVQTLHRLEGSTRAVPFVEDIAVPPEVLPGFLVQVQNILKKHQVTASLFSHAGHGQLHLRPFLNLADASDITRLRQMADDLYDAVIESSGTISGEHGDGLSRTPYVQRQYGELYSVFREIKRIFDPHNILNPGKVVGNDPDLMTRNLRPLEYVPGTWGEKADAASQEPAPTTIELQLNWDSNTLAHEANSCNGCGACRNQSAEVRMCPIFRFAPIEAASPRAKANLMRAVLTGQLDASYVTSDEFKAVADLCVNCHMCRLECPAGVDIPRLMIEAKGAYVATNGFHNLSDRLSVKPDMLARLGATFPLITNWMFRTPAARWLLEKTMGIARSRKLPRFTRHGFVRRSRRRGLTQPTRRSGPKVLYFVDRYANYHDVQLADALVSVLEHNAVSVFVHPEQKSSGMSSLAVGALEDARRIARHNVSRLAAAIRQGYHVVATEPSAALALTREYPALLGDDDTRLVAENSSEACDYLWKLHRQGKLQLDFRPVNTSLAYHTPCHLKALEVGTPGANLLRLIPGLRLHTTEHGCSGMAGTWGMKRENFRNSLRIGRGLITSLRQPTVQAGTTECSACKMQMEQGTTKPTVHPIKLLAFSYGLMPEVENLLRSHSEDLVVT
jgi:FAD/FMN-containing dehydrogenase/Fe-S oxidoreductase